MAKRGGLGNKLLYAGYDVSGDIQQLGTVRGGPVALDFTGIDKFAMERLGGLRDGELGATTFFNPGPEANAVHKRLSLLPMADTILTYLLGSTLGDDGAAINALQANYDGKRGGDGQLLFEVQALGNGYGLEWGISGTAGLRTDAAPANGASLDNAAATNFGLQAYLHVAAFTGTSVTVAVQDSADNSSFATIATFTAATDIRSQRIATAGGATIRRYLRVITTGTFTNAQFQVLLCRNATAVIF